MSPAAAHLLPPHTNKQNVVEPKAEIVREEEARAQEKADAAKAIKDECEADLAEVRLGQ